MRALISRRAPDNLRFLSILPHFPLVHPPRCPPRSHPYASFICASKLRATRKIAFVRKRKPVSRRTATVDMAPVREVRVRACVRAYVFCVRGIGPVNVDRRK